MMNKIIARSLQKVKRLFNEFLSKDKSLDTNTLKEGDVIEGVVIAQKKYGYIIDIGKLKGLLHVSNLTWGSPYKDTDILKVNDIVKVVVLKIDYEKKQVDLGFKQLNTKQWLEKVSKYEVGETYKGTICTKTKNGRLIELEKGVIGYLSLNRIHNNLLNIDVLAKYDCGEIVDVVIININLDKCRIYLCLKLNMPLRNENIASSFKVNSVWKGKVVKFIVGGVIVELDKSVTGMLHASNIFWTKIFVDVEKVFSIDQIIDVCILNINAETGKVSLGHRQLLKNPWDELVQKYAIGTETTGKVIATLKNIVVVELPDGVHGIVPYSQLYSEGLINVERNLLMNKVLSLCVVSIDKISYRIVLKDTSNSNSTNDIGQPKYNDLPKLNVGFKLQNELNWNKNVESYEIGTIVKGKVKKILMYCAYIELEFGIVGFVHISDLSWKRKVKHPSQVLSVGNEINVVILSIDKELCKISLGIKQLEEDPWEDVEKRYVVNSIHKCIIKEIVKYGAFVELDNGIEGLIHITEMTWSKNIKQMPEMVSLGAELDAMILSIDKANRRISLGIKQLKPDPWDSIEQKYPVNSRHKCIVVVLVPFGAFVELDNDIIGLIHISVISWVKKIRHPTEVFKKGQEIEAVVIGIDRSEKKISMGYKQLKNDPWDELEKAYLIGTNTLGIVVRALKSGLIVTLPLGVEAFVQSKQSEDSDSSEPKTKFRKGDVLDLEVVEFDKASRKIILSLLQ